VPAAWSLPVPIPTRDTTTVSAGTLQVDGSLLASAATVNSGATLAGSGTVQAVNAVGGSVSPGVQGPRHFELRQRLSQCRFDLRGRILPEPAPAPDDLLNVTGTVSLLGALSVNLSFSTRARQPVHTSSTTTGVDPVAGSLRGPLRRRHPQLCPPARLVPRIHPIRVGSGNDVVLTATARHLHLGRRRLFEQLE